MPMGIMRRFRYITENEQQRKMLDTMLDRKGITRLDLILILDTIAFNEPNREVALQELRSRMEDQAK